METPQDAFTSRSSESPLGVWKDSFRPEKLYKGAGCSHCFGTGFRGRSVIAELLPITEEVRSLIVKRAPSHDIKREAVRAGMKTMREDGLDKVAAGITTLEEVLAATDED